MKGAFHLILQLIFPRLQGENIEERVQRHTFRDEVGFTEITAVKKWTHLPDFVAELMALSARLKPSADPGNKEGNNALAFVEF